MTTCDEHGDAIVVYDGYNCPACDQLSEQEKDYDNKIVDLDNEVAEANDRIVELETELESSKQ